MRTLVSNHVRSTALPRLPFDGMITAEDLSTPTRVILDRQGFVPCDGSEADQDCQEIWAARFHELAADPPGRDEVERRLDHLLASARLDAPWGLLDVEMKCRAWVVTERIFLPERADFPYHHTRAEMADFAARTATDSARHLKDAAGLILDTRPLPEVAVRSASDPSVGARFAHHVSVNGNHRAVIFRTLDLPVVPAEITVCSGMRWTMPHCAWLIAELDRHGLVKYIDAGPTFDADPLVGWVCSIPDRGKPGQVVARLARLESLIGATVKSPARDLLSNRRRLELAKLRDLV